MTYKQLHIDNIKYNLLCSCIIMYLILYYYYYYFQKNDNDNTDKLENQNEIEDSCSNALNDLKTIDQ